PPPRRDRLGQPFGPFAWRVVSLHFLKNRPFTIEPFGKRSVVRSSCRGAGAAGAVMLNVVRSERAARTVSRSRFEYFPVNETCWVVTAAAPGTTIAATSRALAQVSNLL